MPKRQLTPEEIKNQLEDELEEEEDELEDEETEESEPIDPDAEYKAQKKRILDKIESQVDLSEFWSEVLANKKWEDILRIYYRANAGIIQKFYTSFTISVTLENDKIVWKYHFFKDGKEISFDITNEEGVKD